MPGGFGLAKIIWLCYFFASKLTAISSEKRKRLSMDRVIGWVTVTGIDKRAFRGMF
jgi:hypothetical protein